MLLYSVVPVYWCSGDMNYFASGFQISDYTRYSFGNAKLFPRKTCSSYLLKRFKDKIGSHTLATEEKASEKKR